MDRRWGLAATLMAVLVALLLVLVSNGPALAGGGGGGGQEAPGPSDLRYEMPTLYVMLAPEDGRLPARLSLGLTIELVDPEVGPLLRQSQPLITDGVWQVASRTTPSDLATAAGMNQLRAELLRILTTTVGYGKITDVFFREFLTQQPI